MSNCIALIAGTGFDTPELFVRTETFELTTPYGKPSSAIYKGYLRGTEKECYVLYRHGEGHIYPPHSINFRANLYALKELGCTHIFSSTTVGSLRKEIPIGTIVVPDDFIDFTKTRKMTFFDSFEPGKMKHVPLPDPFAQEMRSLLLDTGKELGVPLHNGGTVLVIEGPCFSTFAESRMFRIWGADLANMTVSTECILANELEIPYATLTMVTNFSCWEREQVYGDVEEVLTSCDDNRENYIKVLAGAINKLA